MHFTIRYEWMKYLTFIWFFCLTSKYTHIIKMKKKWNKKKITRKIMISKLSFRNVNEMLLIHAMKFERCNQTRKCKHLLVFIHNLRNQNCFVMWNCSCIENATKIIILSSIQLFLFIFNLEVLFGSMVCKCRTLYYLIRVPNTLYI